jgi:hypothetical protein
MQIPRLFSISCSYTCRSPGCSPSAVLTHADPPAVLHQLFLHMQIPRLFSISCSYTCRSPGCSAGGGQSAEPERPGGGGRRLLRVLGDGQPCPIQGHLAPQREYRFSLGSLTRKYDVAADIGRKATHIPPKPAPRRRSA